MFIVMVSLLSGSIVGAQPSVWGPPPTRIVRIGDLDLSREAGRKVLHRRVKFAVTAVCGEADLRDLGAVRVVKACRKRTLADVAPRVEAIIAKWRPGQAHVALDVVAAAP